MSERKINIEVCVESIGSALTAQECGAVRVEYCDNMAEGGTTPSHGQIVEARRRLDIALYPIVRARGGDFVYTEAEFAVMREDVRFCGEAGCDGVVIGMLHPEGRIDTERCAELVAIAREYGMGVTFHRAFDVCRDLPAALEEIIALGCERVLTSGGAPTAQEGVGAIARLVEQAAGRISIMAGSGVTPENAEGILRATGCGELHGTFRSRRDSAAYNPGWAEYGVWHADPDKIKAVVGTIAGFSS